MTYSLILNESGWETSSLDEFCAKFRQTSKVAQIVLSQPMNYRYFDSEPVKTQIRRKYVKTFFDGFIFSLFQTENDELWLVKLGTVD